MILRMGKSRRVGKLLIQLILIDKQDVWYTNAVKTIGLAHHLRATSYRYNEKIDWKRWSVIKTAGKMPPKVYANANIADDILSTLPRSDCEAI